MHTDDDGTARPAPGLPARRAATVRRALAVLAAFLLAVSGAVGAGSVARAEPAKATAMVLVLDASGSMNEPDGHGGTKIKAAKAALKTIIGQLPSDLQVGLRVYGHRVPSKPDHAKACQDTQLIAPVAPLDKAGLAAAIDGFKALGETPIGTSLAAAAKDLPAGASGSIVLVSDGQDSCAPPQPCDVAKQLKASGVQLTVDTVGLKVDATAKSQLTCISDATGGTYTDVQDTAKLAESLGTIASRTRRTATVGGQPVEGKATQEEAPKLTVGKYSTDVVTNETLYYAFDLAAGQKLKIRMTLDAQKLPTVFDTGCCIKGILQNVDGDQLGYVVDVPDAGKLKRVVVETNQPLEKDGTVYLELQNNGATAKAGAALPIALEVEISGAAGPTGSAGASGSGVPPSGAGAGAGAGSPGAPGPTVTVTAAPVGGGTGTGHSSSVLAAAALGGLVAGLAVGALGAVLLLRRLGRGAATPPSPVPGAPGPPAYGGPAGPPPYGGPAGPPPYGGSAAAPAYGGSAGVPPHGAPAGPHPYAPGPVPGRPVPGRPASPPQGSGTLPPYDGG